jgi:hypothetical protein
MMFLIYCLVVHMVNRNVCHSYIIFIYLYMCASSKIYISALLSCVI